MNSYQLETLVGWVVVIALAPVVVFLSLVAGLHLWARRVLGGRS